MEEIINKDAEGFANALKKVTIGNSISIGNFKLFGEKGQEFNNERDMLEGVHGYKFPLLSGDLQLSVQLYENISKHYRLFCFTKFNGKSGMTFSMNLTTEKESDNIIFLTQKIKFTEQYEGSKELGKAHRRQKQVILAEMLHNLDLTVTDNNELILGIYNPEYKSFVNTNGVQFLNDFIVTSILKGHFQGNKGYQLEILPSFSIAERIAKSRDSEISQLPSKVVDNKSKRNIPLGMRYKVLHRDDFKCFKCGRSAEDGIKLHIDHIKPYSLGGLTELDNLQTLCNQCNIGKSNKFIG